jgi:hypothetical protein
MFNWAQVFSQQSLSMVKELPAAFQLLKLNVAMETYEQKKVYLNKM